MLARSELRVHWLLRTVLHIWRWWAVVRLHGHALVDCAARMLMHHARAVIVRLVHHLRRHVATLLHVLSRRNLRLLRAELVHIVSHAAVLLHVRSHGARP